MAARNFSATFSVGVAADYGECYALSLPLVILLPLILDLILGHKSQ